MQFTISSAEGLPIRGDLDIPEKPRALVVIVHGFKGFKDWGFFPWIAGRFLAHRFAVCRFNMSRSGIGEDPESFDRLDLFADDTYSTELADLHAVVAYAQARLPKVPTFLFGHSRGGAIAVLGAHEVSDLRAVIAWSPIARCHRWDEQAVAEWRERGFLEIVNARTRQVMRLSTRLLDDLDGNAHQLDVVRAVERLHRPLLVVHGGADESVPDHEGRLLAAAAADGSLLVINGAGHTFNAIHPLVDLPFPLLLAAEATAHFIKAHVPVRAYAQHSSSV